MNVEAILQFHTILDQVISEYRKVFGDLHSKGFFIDVKGITYTSEEVLIAGESRLAESVMEFC
jgi:hypothetical protein